jgi:hypothetical protein
VIRRFDAAIEHAFHGDAVLQRVELFLTDVAMGAHAIAAQPTCRRQFQDACETAVIGQQQQAFGVDIEPADADDARQVLRQRGEDGRASLGVGMGRHQPARLVVQEQPRTLGGRHRRPAGDEITAPLTETRPSTIQASASRREARPARAMTLAMRSPGISFWDLSGMIAA